MADSSGGYTPITAGGGIQTDPFSSPLAANVNPLTAARKSDPGVVTDRSKTQPHEFDHQHEPDPTGPQDPVTTPASELMDQLTNLTPQQMLALQDKLIAAGYLASGKRTGTDDDATRTGYYQLLQDTANYNSSGQNYTPDELLNIRSSALGTGGGAAGRHADTATSTSVNLSDPLTAQALIDKILTERLGRHPTAEQKAEFTTALQGAERANPNTTTTTTSPVGQYDTSQTSTTSGGIDTGQFADNYATQNFGSESNTFQAATSLYDTALQVLGIGGR